jgi:hypothetical protein
LVWGQWEQIHPRSNFGIAAKNRIALALVFAHNPPMLARVFSAAVNGIEAFPVEVEVNSGWGDTTVVLIMSISPILIRDFLLVENQSR